MCNHSPIPAGARQDSKNTPPNVRVSVLGAQLRAVRDRARFDRSRAQAVRAARLSLLDGPIHRRRPMGFKWVRRYRADQTPPRRHRALLTAAALRASRDHTALAALTRG